MVVKLNSQVEDLLEILTNLHHTQDEYQIIIDEEACIYIVPPLQGYFIENRQNQQTIEQLNLFFKEYLITQFIGFPQAFQEIIQSHLDILLERAYQNFGWNQFKSGRITVGFLKGMLKELHELIAVIGRNPSDSEEILEIRRLFSLGLELSFLFDDVARDKIFSIFKEIGDRNTVGEIFSFEQGFYLPEVLVAEYLTKIGACYGFENGETIKVPFVIQKKRAQKKWTIINYRVDILPIGKEISAYGFLPETQEAPPLLLFCARGSQVKGRRKIAGSFSYLKSKGIGYRAFKIGEKAIENWLQESLLLTKRKAILLGNEIGGALVGYTMTHLYPLVQRGMTFNGIDVDETTTQLWKSLESTERPALHNFYLSEDNQFPSYHAIGENYDILREEEASLTQLDRASQLAFDKDIILCRHRSEDHTNSVKLSSFILPLFSTLFVGFSTFFSWVSSQLSSHK